MKAVLLFLNLPHVYEKHSKHRFLIHFKQSYGPNLSASFMIQFMHAQSQSYSKEQLHFKSDLAELALVLPLSMLWGGRPSSASCPDGVVVSIRCPATYDLPERRGCLLETVSPGPVITGWKKFLLEKLTIGRNLVRQK